MHFLCILASSLLALTAHAQNLDIGGPSGGINLGPPGGPVGGGISIGGNPGSIPAPGSGVSLGGPPPPGGVSLGGGSPGVPTGGIGSNPGASLGSSPSGGIVVGNNDGTVIPGPGTVGNFNNNANNNTNSNRNNNGGGGRFGGGFGSINFPDFSNFESLGNDFSKFPTSGNNQNGGGGGAVGGGSGGVNLNSGIFDKPRFPDSGIPSFGNNINIPNTGGNINTGGGIGNTNRFPDLSSINFDFGLGNTGAGGAGGSGFPGGFGSNSGLFPPFPGGPGFPGTGSGGSGGSGGGSGGRGGGGINLPPINNNPGDRYGSQRCDPPTDEALPVQVSSTPLTQDILNAFFLEASVRPEIQVIAQFFNTTTGAVAQPKVEDNTLACPANYSVLTKFVTDRNAECWVVPAPTQPPVMYAKCRCSRCRSGGAVGRYSANMCKSKLTTVTVIAFCPLAAPVKIVPVRVQIPTACRCMLGQTNNPFLLKK